MLIDPRHLEQLSVIVDVGTLREAADKLGTSQPALSRMISMVEGRINMLLFERASRPLKPTVMGEALANQGRTIRLARLRAAETVESSTRGYFGVLKIGAPPFLCDSLVSQAIAGFIADRPNARIDLVPDYYPGLQDKLQQNQIDFIVGPNRFVSADNKQMVVEPLFKDLNVVVGRNGNPFFKKEKISGADLEQMVWIAHSERSALRDDMDKAFRRLGAQNVRIAFQSEAAGAVIELLRSTDFLTMLPRYAIWGDKNKLLQTRVLLGMATEHEVSIISSVDREETKLSTDFKLHLHNLIAQEYDLKTLAKH